MMIDAFALAECRQVVSRKAPAGSTLAYDELAWTFTVSDADGNQLAGCWQARAGWRPAWDGLGPEGMYSVNVHANPAHALADAITNALA